LAHSQAVAIIKAQRASQVIFVEANIATRPKPRALPPSVPCGDLVKRQARLHWLAWVSGQSATVLKPIGQMEWLGK
jgi:hypothetical protein